MRYTSEMKDKLQRIIDDGKRHVRDAMTSIVYEYDHRKDFIAKPEVIRYDVNGGLHAIFEDRMVTDFTQHSRNQLLSKINMPVKFYDKLVSHDDMKDLAAQNIHRLTQKFATDGLMFRVIDQKLVKGTLSPSFGRYDASPLFHAFTQKCIEAGYVPMMGKNTDYRYQLTFILPEMEEIAPDEYICFAITFTTSDYGAGANDVSLSVLRIWCANLAQGFGLLRKIHIGSRFNDVSSFVEMSETTHRLDVKTIASAIGDIVVKSIDLVPKFRAGLLEAAEPDHDYNVDSVVKSLRQKFGQETAEGAKTLYNQAGLQELPQAPGAWRMSNVLSLMAHNASPDGAIDLQKEAFNILKIAA